MTFEVREARAKRTEVKDAGSLKGITMPLEGSALFSESCFEFVRETDTRLLALERDAAQTDTFDLSRLWHELVIGNWRFRDVFCTEQRSYALLEETAAGCARPVPCRTLEVLARFLTGETQKSLSFELGLGLSTVASRIQGAIRAIGLRCNGSRAPVLLSLAAHAACRPAPVWGRQSQLFDSQLGQLSVISFQRLDLDFPVCLSVAESAVLRALVDGQSHAEISAARESSSRTVANQVASAFRKLSVSGRGELIQLLIAHSLYGHAAPRRPASSGSELRAQGILAELSACLPETLVPVTAVTPACLPNGYSQPGAGGCALPAPWRPAPSSRLPFSAGWAEEGGAGFSATGSIALEPRMTAGAAE
jgi:DNA-binding CsgD family transcriptional regulator